MIELQDEMRKEMKYHTKNHNIAQRHGTTTHLHWLEEWYGKQQMFNGNQQQIEQILNKNKAK
jgi:hypothetical protein